MLPYILISHTYGQILIPISTHTYPQSPRLELTNRKEKEAKTTYLSLHFSSRPKGGGGTLVGVDQISEQQVVPESMNSPKFMQLHMLLLVM